MALRIGRPTGEKSSLKKFNRVLWLSMLLLLLVILGNMACKKEAVEEQADTEDIINFEGVVKVGFGKYLYVPEARGFDIVVQGQVDSGDASVLVDKEVRGKGEFSPNRPSILVADSIDVKESGRNWRNVFTRTEEVVLDDYFDVKTRDEFEELKEISYDKKESWEGKEKGKVYGKLETRTVTEGEELKEVYRIIVLDEENKEVGKVIVDSISESTLYYAKKLRLFDRLWFYVTIKETVPWRTRVGTSELFHADVFFAGLF